MSATRGGDRTTPVAEEVWYLPTYLIDNKSSGSTGHVSLFVRLFRLRDRKRGPVLQVATDVWTFADEAAMAAAIERLDLAELPADTEGDLLYVPESLALDDARVERTSARISPPEEALS